MIFEAAKLNLTKLIEWAKTNDNDLTRNEAATRLHLIDSLLMSCLSWPKEECHPEDRFDGKHPDYSLGGAAKKCVIEAKKEGSHFELPVGFNKPTCSLSTLTDANKDIKAAVKQTLKYCQARGIPIGAVCNGHQLIAFLGSRLDGIPPIEGRAIVFSSLADMQARFDDFWNALSKPGVKKYTLHRLLRIEAIPPPEKLAGRIGSDYPGFKMRNSIQNELKILGELFLEDIERSPELEEEFQKECYCASGALSQYTLISRQILESRYSILFQKEIATTTAPAVTKHGGVSNELTADILSASLSRRPIILLGHVGVGKSMFIRHFIALEAKDILTKAIVIYVDFGREPALPNELSHFVLETCRIQLLRKYKIDIEERNFVRGVYNLELKRFANSIYRDLRETNEDEYRRKEIEFLEAKLEDHAAHMKACLEHVVKGQGRQVVVFLDNVDQRPLEFQDEVFLIGHGFSESWPVTVFISLRPDTFFHSKSKGSLAGYQPRVFTIAPPRVDRVISKRLEFALSALSNTGRLTNLPEGVSLHSDTLHKYFTVILDSFRRNEDLVALIDNLSGGNVRQAIDFLTVFTGSSHVDTNKILNIYQETGRYIIPVHEFMRAIIYGDNEYYSPSTSPIANLFDISTNDGREHFLLALILSYIGRLGSVGEQQGFVPVAAIFEHGQSLGFQPAQIQFALERALKKRLLESDPQFSVPADVLSYRLTTVGAYTANKVAFDFSYIDGMTVDTPIVDQAARDGISVAKSLQERLLRAEMFCDYLDLQWDALADEELVFDWPAGSMGTRTTIRSLLARHIQRDRPHKQKWTSLPKQELK